METLGKIIDGVKTIFWSYMSLDENIKTLKRKCETLHCREIDVNTELEYYAESSRGKKPRKAVHNWLQNVEKTRTQVESVDAAMRQGGVVERVKLVGQVDELTKQVDALLEEGKFPQGLTLSTHRAGKIEFPTKPLVGKSFGENKNKMWRFLMDPQVLTVGIWEMGGVGKTHIDDEAQQQCNAVDDVFWVSASQKPNIRRLQDEFGRAIKMTLYDEQDERKRVVMFVVLKYNLGTHCQCFLFFLAIVFTVWFTRHW